MDSGQGRFVLVPQRKARKPTFFEHGFWWWWDPRRRDYFVGPSPSICVPSWSEGVSL